METTRRFETLLSKIAKWRWQSSPVVDHQHWPKNVTACLEEKFHLLPQEMLAFQYVTLSGSFGGFPVTMIRLFDREKVRNNGIVVRNYHDLHEYPEFIVFEGYILKDGLVHLRKKEPLVTAGVS